MISISLAAAQACATAHFTRKTAGVGPESQHATARPEPSAAGRTPSTFEARWQAACEAGGTLDSRSTLELKTHYFCAEGAHDVWRELCTKPKSPKETAVKEALAKSSAELEACFQSAQPGSWVSVSPRCSVARRSSPELPPAVISCVADRVETALLGVDTSDIEEVAVPMLAGNMAPKGLGTLSKDLILDTIHNRVGEVRACYEAALDVWPRLHGKTTVKFVIDPSGRVQTVRTAQSDLSNPSLECCINTAVRGWRFAEPAGGGIVIVNYPFVLQEQR